MKYWFLLVFVAQMGFAQQNCNCDVSLNRLITKMESDYPGFEEKTKDKVLYASFKQQLQQQAEKTEQKSCFEILKKYTSFFRDGHICIHPATTINDKGNATTEVLKIDTDKFLKKKYSAHQSLEGVWGNKFEWTGGVGYELGVVKTGNHEYTGFVIKSTSDFWKPKEVKFKLFADGKYEFYFFDKTKKTGTYEIVDNQIIYFKDIKSSFTKITPIPTLSEKEVNAKIGALYGFSFKKLTDKTSIITMPSFDYPFVDIIKTMISDNQNLLENSENLIVDIRGNSGGTDNSYRNLMPYIMTNASRTLGVEYLVTPTLVNGLKGYVEANKNSTDKERQEELKMVQRWLGLFENKMGKYVNVGDEKASYEEFGVASKSPKNIVVLTDKRVGSSAENFVMKTKQSKKVKVLGTVTSGGLDYASARMFDFGCPEYKLQLPTWRSMRLPDFPVDNIGLQPDIYMDRFVEDWVQYAVDYLEN